MYHIRLTASIAESLGYDEEIVIACILHDTLEDTVVSYNDIKKAFGLNIAEIVYCVTDELGRNRTERKAATYPKIKRNWKAVAVKICDRIANVTHSKEYNRDKYEMYRKEYNDFHANLNIEHSELQKGWDMLEDI